MYKSNSNNHNCKNIQSKTSERESKENDDRGPKSRGNPLLSFLENMYRSMTNPQKIDPVRECSKFIGKYEQEYGNTHPPFSRRDFHSVVNRAHTDAKFTLVYLHCGVHQDTPTFCRKILANTALNDMLRGDNIQVWGGDVFQSEARWVSHMLKATTFPFLALLSPKSSSSSRKYYVLHSVLGSSSIVSVNDLMRQLSTVMNAHKSEIDAIRREQLEIGRAHV